MNTLFQEEDDREKAREEEAWSRSGDVGDRKKIQRKRRELLESITDSRGFELLVQRHGLALDFWNQTIPLNTERRKQTRMGG
jgi:hypothetical protein